MKKSIFSKCNVLKITKSSCKTNARVMEVVLVLQGDAICISPTSHRVLDAACKTYAWLLIKCNQWTNNLLMHHLHVYTYSWPRHKMRLCNIHSKQKYENWNYHLGASDATGCWINIFHCTQQRCEERFALHVGNDGSNIRTKYVIRNFMIYRSARTINKGSSVINIENSDNGQMNGFFIMSVLFLLLLCWLFVSPPCVQLSINERNLIIHCSMWLFTYLSKFILQFSSIISWLEFVCGKPRVCRQTRPSTTTSSTSKPYVQTTWR